MRIWTKWNSCWEDSHRKPSCIGPPTRDQLFQCNNYSLNEIWGIGKILEYCLVGHSHEDKWKDSLVHDSLIASLSKTWAILMLQNSWDIKHWVTVYIHPSSRRLKSLLYESLGSLPENSIYSSKKYFRYKVFVRICKFWKLSKPIHFFDTFLWLKKEKCRRLAMFLFQNIKKWLEPMENVVALLCQALPRCICWLKATLYKHLSSQRGNFIALPPRNWDWNKSTEIFLSQIRYSSRSRILSTDATPSNRALFLHHLAYFCSTSRSTCFAVSFLGEVIGDNMSCQDIKYINT